MMHHKLYSTIMSLHKLVTMHTMHMYFYCCCYKGLMDLLCFNFISDVFAYRFCNIAIISML